VGAQDVTRAPAPQADRAASRLHLLDETLRIPFGEDWGGETRFFARFKYLDVGVFARAWAETVCDRPDCGGRGVQAGAEIKANLTPALDVGLDLGVQRGSTERTGSVILPRLRMKF
jgi:hypothetical protein